MLLLIIYLCYFLLAKKVSKFDPEIKKEIEISLAKDLKDGAPKSWYPNCWLCFWFLGRPAPVDKRFLVVTESKANTNVDALEMLRSTANKSTRKVITALITTRKKGIVS